MVIISPNKRASYCSDALFLWPRFQRQTRRVVALHCIDLFKRLCERRQQRLAHQSGTAHLQGLNERDNHGLNKPGGADEAGDRSSGICYVAT